MHPDEMASRYEPGLYARPMRLMRSRSDALDLVQDTYERAPSNALSPGHGSVFTFTLPTARP